MPAKTPATRSPSAAKHAVGGLLRILDLEPLEVNLFRGVSPDAGWQRVFGGQVLAQALAAAGRTVPDERVAHSLHAYFLLPGDPKVPIVYEVERIRDGGSFTTRRVKGIQHGRAMFAMSISFQKVEDGYDHQSTMPDVPPPEDLPTERELAKKLVKHLPENMRSYWERERPIEMRPVDTGRYFERAQRTAAQHIWMRANGTLCVRLHAARHRADCPRQVDV
jgi:acyl-CoA thioesterase II